MQKIHKVSLQPLPDPPQSSTDFTARETVFERLAAFTTGYRPDPEQEQHEVSYYDYPVLKQPF